MTSHSAAPSPAFRAILYGGLIAAFSDMVFAFARYGLRLGTFQSVLGGIIGSTAAHEGGVPAFVMGLSLHYLIGILWSAIYCLASRRIRVLVQYPIPAGLAYGIVIFYGMNCVVLPLSALHGKAWPLPWAPWALAVHMVFVGLPIAWATRRGTDWKKGAGDQRDVRLR